MSIVERRDGQQLWVGTYPTAGQGTPAGLGEGIWTVWLDPARGALTGAHQLCATPAPSFLALDPTRRLLYAVNERVAGGLTVLREDGAHLTAVATLPTLGDHPCHLLVDSASGVVVVANYTTGSVAVIRLGPDGLPSAEEPSQLIGFSGSGPVRDRQESAHAHYLLPAPGSGTLLVCDLGADCIRRLRFDRRHELVDDGIAVRLPPATGPRHAVFSADGRWLYVLGELDGRLHTVAWDHATAAGTPLGSRPVNPDAEVPGAAAHLVREGDLLSCGSRGDDVIARFRLGADGSPRPAGTLRLPGAWPRHHAAAGSRLVVAQQRRGGLIALDHTGAVTGQADIPSPACILPRPTLHEEVFRPWR